VANQNDEIVRLYIDNPRMLVDIDYSDENLPLGQCWQIATKDEAERTMHDLIASGFTRGHDHNTYA